LLSVTAEAIGAGVDRDALSVVLQADVEAMTKAPIPQIRKLREKELLELSVGAMFCMFFILVLLSLLGNIPATLIRLTSCTIECF
jgi:hypothetical protein